MLLSINSGTRHPRLAVLAYDIGCPRRARRVRCTLEAVHRQRQYSVFEVMQSHGQVCGLLAELSALCDLASDRLALWWPFGGARVHVAGLGLAATQRRAEGDRCVLPAEALQGCGNFIVSYDICDADRLRAVARRIAPEGAMVQRSVYWLRLPAARVLALLQFCCPLLGEGDRLWAYPLQGADDLWRVGTEQPSLLPVTQRHQPWRTA